MFQNGFGKMFLPARFRTRWKCAFGGRLLKGRFPGTRHRGWIASVSVRPTKAALARLPCDEAIHERITARRGRTPTGRAPSIPGLPPFDAALGFQAIHDILLDQSLPRLQPTKDDVFLQSCGGLLAFALCNIFGNLAHSNPLNPLRSRRRGNDKEDHS